LVFPSFCQALAEDRLTTPTKKKKKKKKKKFFCGVHLVLRSGVFTLLDLDEVDVTPSNAEVFRSVLSGVGGSTNGWRCCWGAPSPPQLPLATTKNPFPYISFLFIVLLFAAMGVTSTKSGRLEVNLSLSGKRGGKSYLGTILLSAIAQYTRGNLRHSCLAT